LRASATGYIARIDAKDFALDLNFAPTQAPLPQGDNGYSRKGPDLNRPAITTACRDFRTSGQVRIAAKTSIVEGYAWLDHEWSSQYMDREAVGWDWIGINLDDGSALMAFRMRRRDGSSHWASATVRKPDGASRSYSPAEVTWLAQRRWTSPRTGATYPVAMRVPPEIFSLISRHLWTIKKATRACRPARFIGRVR
jgi:predicted secreted hydrolase